MDKITDNFETKIDLDEQSRIRRDKLKELRENNNSPYELTGCEVTGHSAQIIENFETLEETEVKVAGRIMSKRGMGKVSFVDLYDRQGKIQIFTKIDQLGEDKYQEWQNLDLGDLVQVTGTVFRTKRGEISIRTSDYVLLAKCLRPLPEKFHGLQDLDTRYRKRYLDLVVNPQVKANFEKRSQIITSIRNNLLAKNFLEVETPLLNTVAHGADARPFITHHNTLDLDLHLRISPELYLKRLIVGGFERVFEIGRNFRNEGMSYKHNPEFTMVEIYQAFANYEDMMKLTEELISQACLMVNGSMKTTYQGTEIDLTPPFKRLSMHDAIKEHAGIDFSASTVTELIEIAKEKGLEVEDSMTKGHLMNLFFDAFCEDKLIQPTFIYDYPVEISPLSKQRKDDKAITERFELFIKGTEYGNAYSELNDPDEQYLRFMSQYEKHKAGDEEACLPDYDYIEALEYGMPPTGGLGIGIDRLVMLLTDSSTIRDVLLFPTMKPLGGQSPVNQGFEGENAKTYDQPATDFEAIDFSKVKVEPLFEENIDFETFSKADFRAVKVLNCEEVPKSKKLLKFTLDDGSDKERVILSGIKENYNTEELIGKTLLAICNLPPRKMMGIDSEGMIISAIHEEEGEEKLNLIILSPRIPAGAKMH